MLRLFHILLSCWLRHLKPSESETRDLHQLSQVGEISDLWDGATFNVDFQGVVCTIRLLDSTLAEAMLRDFPALILNPAYNQGTVLKW